VGEVALAEDSPVEEVALAVVEPLASGEHTPWFKPAQVQLQKSMDRE